LAERECSAEEVMEMDLRELVEELRRQRENSLDIICRDEDIEAIPDKEHRIIAESI